MIAEREQSTSEAEFRLKKLCDHLKVSTNLSFINTKNPVAICDLYDSSGKHISSGAGKGEACGLGAIAESIEHYLTETEKYNPSKLISTEEIHRNLYIHDDWLLRSLPDSCLLPTYELESVERQTKIYVPAILMTPSPSTLSEAAKNPATAFLVKYSTNSGTALGCTENEALLHATNEVIERHALSIYYLSICNLTQPLKLKRPADSFLYETFSSNENLLQHSKSLNIYISREFYANYFCIAFPKDSTSDTLSTPGSGYSSSPAVALYRAVSEQLQCDALKGFKETEEDNTVASMLSGSQTLRKLLHPVPEQEPEAFHPRLENHGLRHQLQSTLINLKKHNRTVFFRTLLNIPGQACAIQVYIPGLERFHLIRSGSPVATQSALSKGARDQYVYR